MTSSLALLGLLLALPLPQSAPTNLKPVQASPYVVLSGNYDPDLPWNCPGGSDACEETLVQVVYPPGAGPRSMGYSMEPLPVLVVLRGANENASISGYPAGWFEQFLHPAGFIGVQPNFPVVGDSGSAGGVFGGTAQPKEDYETILSALGYLIQHLRRHAKGLNIDPDQIFVMGRSGGAIWAYGLGLRHDYQDPTSVDPTEHYSSRPDGICAFSGPTAFECFASTTKFSAEMKAFFPKATLVGAPLQEKLAISPWYWLENPQLFDRATTPPMFMGYNLAYWTGGCGDTDDVHSGAFGYWMKQHVDDYTSSTNALDLAKQTVLYDSNDFLGQGQGVPEALAWCQQVMQGPPPGMKLVLDGGGWILNAGQVTTWKNLGAAPGGPVFFFFGASKGSYPITACGATLPWEIGPSVHFLALEHADALGRAQTSLFIPSGAQGLTIHLQTLDILGCSVSNLLTVKL